MMLGGTLVTNTDGNSFDETFLNPDYRFTGNQDVEFCPFPKDQFSEWIRKKMDLHQTVKTKALQLADEFQIKIHKNSLVIYI